MATIHVPDRLLSALKGALIGALSGTLSAGLMFLLVALSPEGYQKFLVLWIPGVVFGCALALAARRSWPTVLTLGTVCGFVYTGVHIAVARNNEHTMVASATFGTLGAVAVALACRWAIGMRLAAVHLGAVSAVGCLASLAFISLYFSPYLVAAFALWQGSVAAALLVSDFEERFAPLGPTWVRTAVDVVGVISAVLGIISYFR